MREWVSCSELKEGRRMGEWREGRTALLAYPCSGPPVTDGEAGVSTGVEEKFGETCRRVILCKHTASRKKRHTYHRG